MTAALADREQAWDGGTAAAVRAVWAPLVLLGDVICHLCGYLILDFQEWDVDHLIPIVIDPGRKTDPSNHHPAHRACNRSRGARLGNRRRGLRRRGFLEGGAAGPHLLPSLSPLGSTLGEGAAPAPRIVEAIPAPDPSTWPAWFPTVPDGQALPRIMTAPHPLAVGSYGAEMLAWAVPRFGMHPKRTQSHRFWQELAAVAALQHDAAGRLLIRLFLLGTARQSGKSWILREICMWRIAQGDRFGEAQTVVHCAAKLEQAEGVWRPAARWAQRLPSTRPVAQPAGLFELSAASSSALDDFYNVRNANGSARIETLDGSAWIPQAGNDQVGVSQSVSLGVVDEAWAVPRWVVDNGLEPTLAEASNPQLWLVSTAGQTRTGEDSDLYPVARAAALATLADPAGTLIMEWSGDPALDPGDRRGWRQASPHWSPEREELLEIQWLKAKNNPNALKAFKMQWLNIWPDASEAGAWLPESITSSAAGTVGYPPLTATVGIESAYSDPSAYAVTFAWETNADAARPFATLTIDAPDLETALDCAGDRRAWAHQAVLEQLDITARSGFTNPTAAQTIAAVGMLRQTLQDDELTCEGITPEQWKAIRTRNAPGGETFDTKASTADIHGIKSLALALWATRAGHAVTGFLFAPKPESPEHADTQDDYRR